MAAPGADEPPTEWIEPATDHRVIRLSREPGTASLYFHQNAYSADGKKLIVTTPGGLSTINLETRETDLVVTGRVGVLVTGRKTGQVYYTRSGSIYATDLEPNVTFTPDMKWIVFRSNMHGATHVYAVEVKKTG